MGSFLRLPVVWFLLALSVSAALSALALWVYANAHTAFGYMVVGALGTCVALVLAFLWFWNRNML